MTVDAWTSAVVLRLSLARRLVASFAPFIAFAVFATLRSQEDGSGWDRADLVIATLIWGVEVCLSLYIQRFNRVELNPRHLYVRSGIRSWTIPSSEVEALSIERSFGSRAVTALLQNGEHRRLPTAGRTEGLWRRNFNGDRDLIESWRSANRTLGPEPGRPAYGSTTDFDWRPTP